MLCIVGEKPKQRIPESLIAVVVAGISSTICTYSLELLKTRLTVQIARAVYDVEEATSIAFDIILEHKEALRSSMKTSVIPAFEMFCKTMFDQVNATFQKRMAVLVPDVWFIQNGFRQLVLILKQCFSNLYQFMLDKIHSLYKWAAVLLQTW